MSDINVVLTPRELLECHKHPEILRALADYHDVKATEADSVSEEYAEAVTLHESRARELRSIADQIEEEY